MTSLTLSTKLAFQYQALLPGSGLTSNQGAFGCFQGICCRKVYSEQLPAFWGLASQTVYMDAEASLALFSTLLPLGPYMLFGLLWIGSTSIDQVENPDFVKYRSISQFRASVGYIYIRPISLPSGICDNSAHFGLFIVSFWLLMWLKRLTAGQDCWLLLFFGILLGTICFHERQSSCQWNFGTTPGHWYVGHVSEVDALFYNRNFWK